LSKINSLVVQTGETLLIFGFLSSSGWVASKASRFVSLVPGKARRFAYSGFMTVA
jgi:hypothetical protein